MSNQDKNLKIANEFFEDWEARKNELTAGQKTLQISLSKAMFTIISAENSNGKQSSIEDNKTSTTNMRYFLTSKEYIFKEVIGCYGQKENSFIVFNMSLKDSIELGEAYQQESLIFMDSYIDLKTYKVNRIDLTNITFDNDLTDYYTEIIVQGESIRFTLDINFSETVEIDRY